MRTVTVRDLVPGDVLVGDAGGRSAITGNIDPSSVVLGALAVETEHGTLYLDPDEEQIVDREHRERSLTSASLQADLRVMLDNRIDHFEGVDKDDALRELLNLLDQEVSA